MKRKNERERMKENDLNKGRERKRMLSNEEKE
jgi:hypothetical protein